MGTEDSLIGLSWNVIAATDLVSAGIVGLAFILLIVFCVLAAKTWHWINIVFVILTFMAGVGAIFGLTKVYHERTTVIKAFSDAELKLDRIQKEADLKIIGNPTSPSYDPGTLRYIDGVLARELAGRGRVWSRGQITAEDNNRIFTFAAARQADFDALKDVVLYAFLEPSVFIGSVRVVEETPQTAKLEAVALADVQEFAQPTGSWSLYEKMPLDRRGTFKRAIIAIAANDPNASEQDKAFAKSLEDESATLDISYYRNLLQSIFLTPQVVNLAADSPEYEALIDQYAFDGLTDGTIENWIDQNSAGRKTPRFEPNPDEIFVKYRFNSDSQKPGGYQVDSNGTIEVDGLFNGLGHAIDPALQAGGTISFSKGDTVLVDQRSADGYKRLDQQIDPFATGEDVEVVDRVYIRQVRDFPYEFVDLTYRSANLDEEILRVQLNNQTQGAVLADAQAQYDERARLIADLESDRVNLSSDLATVTSLVSEKQQQVSQQRQLVSSLEKKIQDSYKQLRELAITLSRKAFAGR